MTLDVGL